jgi:hypothetical protein
LSPGDLRSGGSPNRMRPQRVHSPWHGKRAKEGKLRFMSTLGGHRRYPEAEIRKLVDELRQEPTA